MRFWILTMMFLLIHFGLNAKAGSRPEISVQSGSSITVAAGMPVLLKDIGGAGFVPAPAMAKAGSIVVFEPLADQEARSFSNSELVRVLKEKIAAEPDLAALKWTYFVPENVKIVGQKNFLSIARINQTLLESLVDKCETCTFRLNSVKVPTVQETQVMTAMDLETSPLKMAGSFLLPLRISFATGADKIYYVTGQVTARAKALVATRALTMGEKINSRDVKEQETEINFTNDAFATLDDLDGKTTGRSIQMGRAIYKSDLKREVVIQRGQMIRAVSGSDAFEVSAQMQAEDNGAVGDTVRLKNPETQKLMSGRVIDRGLVRIQ